jgi:hypothetical protein
MAMTKSLWIPVSTAPHSNRPVLVWLDGPQGYWNQGCYGPKTGGWFIYDRPDLDVKDRVTHWAEDIQGPWGWPDSGMPRII